MSHTTLTPSNQGVARDAGRSAGSSTPSHEGVSRPTAAAANAFTPGPWWGGTRDSPWYVRRESDDACIAHMEDGGHCDPDIILIDDDEREANARLIAAAPDLYEALVEARSILANSDAESGCCMCGDPVAGHSIGSGHAPVDSHLYMAGRLIETINAALAKASAS